MIRYLRNPEQNEIVLTFVGDIMLKKQFSKGLKNEYQTLFEVIKKSDLAFANLETALTTKETEDLDYPLRLKADPSLADELTWAGFDVVSLANNHTMNYGPEGLIDTMQALNERGIKYAGGGTNIDEAFAPLYVSAKNVKNAFLSFYSDPSITAQGAGVKKPGLAYLRAFEFTYTDPTGSLQSVFAPVSWDVQAMKESIHIARKEADFVVVTFHFHWTKGSVTTDFKLNQQFVTHTAIDAGADIIIGHGPHILRAIEKYRGKYIFYSLGNFIDQLPDHIGELIIKLHHPERTSDLMPKLKRFEGYYQSVVPRVVLSNNQVSSVELLPIRIERHGDYKGIPLFAHGKAGKKIIDNLAEMSSTYGTRIVYTDWFGIIEGNY